MRAKRLKWADVQAEQIKNFKEAVDVLNSLPKELQGNLYLVKEVQKLITEGWKPQGGIASTDTGLYQAMVKSQSESVPSS